MPKQLVLGLCPIGKFVFSHEEALRFKGEIRERLDRWQIRVADLEGVLPDGIVRDQKHVEPAVRHFQEQRIDALFIPHCNFGTEGAAAMIAKKCGVPTLLWGPRDEAPLPDGTRLRDSLCGMLATSGVLHMLRRSLHLHRELPHRRRAVPPRRRPFYPRRTGRQDAEVDAHRTNRPADRLLLVHDRQRGRTAGAVRRAGAADRPGRSDPSSPRAARPPTARHIKRSWPSSVNGSVSTTSGKRTTSWPTSPCAT